MSSRRRLASLLLFTLTIGQSPIARAAPDAATQEADRKFDEGRAAMKAGKYSEACPLFAESYRLDPQPGGLFTLAECEAKWGKIARAKGHYDEYLTTIQRLSGDERTKQAAREKIAVQQRDALAKEVPELTLVLPAKAPAAALAGLVVKRNGVAVPAAELGQPALLDPGDYSIEVVLSTGETSTQQLTLGSGQKQTLELKLPATTPEGPTETPPTGPPAKPPGPPGRTRMPLVLGLGGGGVVALGIGTVLGVMALGKKGDADDQCRGTACNAEGFSAVEDGRTLGWVSTVAFGVAGALMVTSVVLFLTDPGAKSSASSPDGGRRPGQLRPAPLSPRSPFVFRF